MPTRKKLHRWKTCGTALLSFAAGSLLTAYWTHVEDVKAESHRVFQLEIYHAVPGKVPKLEERFRSASQLQAKHNLDVIGYWVPTDPTFGNTDPAFANTFVYLVAHANQEKLGRVSLRSSLPGICKIRKYRKAHRRGGLNIHAADRLLGDEIAPFDD